MLSLALVCLRKWFKFCPLYKWVCLFSFEHRIRLFQHFSSCFFIHLIFARIPTHGGIYLCLFTRKLKKINAYRKIDGKKTNKRTKEMFDKNQNRILFKVRSLFCSIVPFSPFQLNQILNINGRWSEKSFFILFFLTMVLHT